jgi:putative ABC transport system permease protein
MWMILSGGLRRRWPEHLLAAVVIAAVVAGLGALRATSAAAEAEVHDIAHRLGRNMLLLPADVVPADFHAQRYRAGLPEGAPERIMSSPAGQHIKSMEARLYGNLQVQGKPLIVVGQDLGWPALPDGRVPAVAGAAAGRALGLQSGGTLQLGEDRLAILEVAEKPPDGLDTAVFMPVAAAQRLLGKPGELSAIRLAGCWCSVDVKTLGSQIEAALPGTRAITVASVLQAQQGTVDVVRRYGTALHLLAAALVVTLVGGLAVAGARRRSRELGLLAAIGVPPGWLGSVLVLECALVGLAGGLVGWLVSGPVAHWLLGAAADSAPSLSFVHVLGAAALSAAAAAVPALRATRLDPAIALRETAA